jgi:hypothetical protein
VRTPLIVASLSLLAGCALEAASATPSNDEAPAADEAAAAAPEGAQVLSAPAPSMPQTYAVSLGGVATGLSASTTGGTMHVGYDKESSSSTTEYFKKHLKDDDAYDPITLQVGLGMKSPIFDWMKAAWQKPGASNTKRDGEIAALDFNMKVMDVLEFHDARLVETKFPVLLRTSSTDLGGLTMKINPEYTSWHDGSGNPPQGSSNTAASLHGFRLMLDGLDADAPQRIESFTVKTTPPAPTADQRVDFPNLVVTLDKSKASSWMGWFDEFAVQHQDNDTHEHSGTLELLDADGDVLATIQLQGVGIVRMARTAPSALPQAGVPSITVDLYVEKMAFSKP